jgi:hypothetical protein
MNSELVIKGIKLYESLCQTNRLWEDVKPKFVDQSKVLSDIEKSAENFKDTIAKVSKKGNSLATPPGNSIKDARSSESRNRWIEHWCAVLRAAKTQGAPENLMRQRPAGNQSDNIARNKRMRYSDSVRSSSPLSDASTSSQSIRVNDPNSGTDEFVRRGEEMHEQNQQNHQETQVVLNQINSGIAALVTFFTRQQGGPQFQSPPSSRAYGVPPLHPQPMRQLQNDEH